MHDQKTGRHLLYFDGEHGDLLGLSAESTRDDVMRAFREKAHEHHPDKGGDAAIFRRLVEARDRAFWIGSDQVRYIEINAKNLTIKTAPLTSGQPENKL